MTIFVASDRPQKAIGSLTSASAIHVEESEYGRQRGNPSSPIRGGFLLLLCFAFVKLSFYIADEPIPPWPTRVLSAIAGVLAFVCGYHGFDLVFDLRIRLASALNSPSPIPIGHEGACAGIEGAGFLLPQRGTHPPSIS